jgi:hypothetical protein
MLGGLVLPLVLAALSGCLTHVSPKEDSGSFGIQWRPDFATARRDAAAGGQPILAVLVAGELKDKC